jgi:hypothetical protein
MPLPSEVSSQEITNQNNQKESLIKSEMLVRGNNKKNYLSTTNP